MLRHPTDASSPDDERSESALRPTLAARCLRAFACLACLLAAVLPAPAAVAEALLEEAPLVTPFSASPTGSDRPRGWEVIRWSARKPLTRYEIVGDAGDVVLHARAEASVSILAHPVAFDVRAAPMAEWRWKVAALIDGADNRVASHDDSPVRVMFAFDGNKSRLSLTDRAVFLLARAAGHDLPYATLMYIWSNELPVGTIVPNPHTRRVQMIVAESGRANVGRWRPVRRNLVDDFRRAFGEEPGRLVAVGVMTDTDNTGSSADAWYGDIALRLP